MSSSTSRSDSEEAYSLSDASSTAHYRSSCDHEDLPQFFSPRRRRSLFSTILIALRLKEPQPEYYDYFSHSPRHESLHGLLKKPKSRDARKCRRTRVGGSFIRRLCIALPIVVLTAFGALHLLHVLVGQGRFIWDVDSPEHFLPLWGRPGHAGQGLVNYPTDATRDVLPVACHSHNDYWRRVPLFDAIHHGCTSVEADVWLFDEDLYIGHSMGALARNRTLQNLYLYPLAELLDQMNAKTEFTNATGRGIFDQDPSQSLVLLIDFKTNGHETYKLVHKQLDVLRTKDYLTYWNGEKVIQKAITVVGTGNAPFDTITNVTKHRDIFFDAPLERLWEAPEVSSVADLPEAKDRTRSNSAKMPQVHSAYKTASKQGKVGTDGVSLDVFNPATSYYASASLRSSVGFIWGSQLSPRQLEIVRGQIRGAHRRGLKARFWDTPSWPVELRNHVWRTLMKEGADVLNVDDLKAAATENWKMRTNSPWKQ